ALVKSGWAARCEFEARSADLTSRAAATSQGRASGRSLFTCRYRRPHEAHSADLTRPRERPTSLLTVVVEVFLEAQVLDAASVAAHQLERLDADADVLLDEVGGNAAVGRLGLDAFRDHRLVGDEQQRAARDLVGETGGEDRRRFHVDGHAARAPQRLLERL